MEGVCAMIRSKWTKWVAAAALGVASLPAMALTVLPAPPVETKVEVKHVERKATAAKKLAAPGAKAKPAAVRLGTTKTPSVPAKKVVTTAKTQAKKNVTAKKAVTKNSTAAVAKKAPATQPVKKGATTASTAKK